MWLNENLCGLIRIVNNLQNISRFVQEKLANKNVRYLIQENESS